MKLSIPDRAAPYILLQRIETQNLGGAIHYNKVGAFLYRLYENSGLLKSLYGFYSKKLEPALRKNSIARQYGDLMQREFETLRPYLKPDTRRILGIGPGVAGLEAYLSDHFFGLNGERPFIYLLDKSRIDEVYYGFHEEASAYNSLDIAKQLLSDNGHPAEKLKTIEADDVDAEKLENIDLVVSLIAWGFHFPVKTYLERIYHSLSSGGQLILDVRKENRR